MSEAIEKLSDKIDALKVSAQKLASQTKSESTKTAYKSDMKRFEHWCEATGRKHLPANEDTIALYIVSMNDDRLKPSTVKRFLTAISQFHKLQDLESPVTWRVREILKGINRTRGTAQKKKRAITLEMLKRILDHVPIDFLGIRDRAILLTGWTGALRRSELCALRVEQIDKQPKGLVLTIERSKTDQEGQGRKIGLPFVDNDIDLCAARAVEKWVDISGIKNGPLFPAIGKGGLNRWHYSVQDRALEPSRIAGIVKEAASRAGYARSEFGAHSLRSGLATTLASAGIEERRIMNITGHESVGMLREYIQQGEIFMSHPILEIVVPV